MASKPFWVTIVADMGKAAAKTTDVIARLDLREANVET